MVIRHVTVGVVVGVLLAAAAASQSRPPQKPAAKEPPHDAAGVPQRVKWWQDEHYKSELHLTTDQSARIEDVFQAALAKAKEVMVELDRREDVLSNLISGSDDVTEAQVLRQSDQVEAIRSELSKSRTLMLFRMRRVLSPDQRTKLAALQKERERQHQSGQSEHR